VFDLDWHVAVIAAATLVALVALRGVIGAMSGTLTFTAIALLLALALEPVVQAVERRFHTRRGVAVGLVVALFVGAVTMIVLLLGPSAVGQAEDLGKELPKVINRLDELPIVGRQLRDNHVSDKVEKWINDLPSKLSGDTAPIEGAARSLLGGALAAVATMLLVLGLLLDGQRLVRAGRSIVPTRMRDRADEIARLFYQVVGRYFAGSLLVAAIAGVTTLIVGTVLHVPLTPLLAVNVALFDLVPQIGGAVGGIPFVALGFTRSPTTGVLCAVFFVLYLQFENNVLQPIVIGEAVDLSPPATMIGAMLGVSIAGVPGALIAIPMMGVLKAIYLEFRPPPGKDHDDSFHKERGGRLTRLLKRLRRRRGT
jgi:predicted PurR-regulated permease PerM